MNDICILGCGYVGARLARRYLDAGRTVEGIVRSAAGASRLSGAGIPSLQLEVGKQPVPEGLFEGRCLFHLAPPVGESGEDLLTRRLVTAFEEGGSPRRVLYVSTTGVYGDCQGAWIDESWPTRPMAQRSLRRLDAEERLRRWGRESGGELVVLRVAGIYGPDRLPLARLREGVPVVRPEEAPFSNRIHVDDLVSICVEAMDRAPSGEIYNVSDGHPTTMTDYFVSIADAAGLPRPPMIPMSDAPGQLSAAMMTYMAESRRLSSQKVLNGLGIRLRYPTLDEGLRDSL